VTVEQEALADAYKQCLSRCFNELTETLVYPADECQRAKLERCRNCCYLCRHVHKLMKEILAEVGEM
jgi:hypothetical protein